nr:carbon-nitrogen hydrolase family protein [uncultured Desulfobulbus sp.]
MQTSSFFKKFRLAPLVFVILLAIGFPWSVSCAEPPPPSVKIALIHFAPEHKQPGTNLAKLLELNRRAAENGASIILNTEMAVSGYSFSSRQDIAQYTETRQGKTLSSMRALAREMGAYIGIPLPERDPATEIYYNSSFMIGPEGNILSSYRKILTVEKRWANPGNPYQPNFVDTPWGRIGTAICADSYSGLLARMAALKGVDLLWVPANWPEMGNLNPVTLWRARALENGFYVAACNRTGKELSLDCSKTFSGVWAPDGREIFKGTSPTTQIFYVDIPLDAQGRFAGIQRDKKMAQRNVSHYRNLYLRPWLDNLTTYYNLPETGELQLHCHVPQADYLDIDALAAAMTKETKTAPALWILPQTERAGVDLDRLAQLAKELNVGIALSLRGAEGSVQSLLITSQGIESFVAEKGSGHYTPEFPYTLLHFGPAAIAMAPASAIEHPELAVSLSKLGVDLVVISEKEMTAEEFLLVRVQSIAGIAIAACTSKEAQLTGITASHAGWDEANLDQAGVAQYTLDTAKTRKKRFHDALDFELLLSR